MQKKIIALAIAGLASSAAFAQTNVTIYGVADVFVATAKSDVSTAGLKDKEFTGVANGGLSGSRLGFRATEDLGGGLSAGMLMEYGTVQMDGGSVSGGASTSGLGNMRQSYVHLTSTSMGSFQGGRIYTPGTNAAGKFDPEGASAFGPVSRITTGMGLSIDGAGGNMARLNNSLAWLSPNWGGFTAQVQYSFGESALTQSATTGAFTAAAGKAQVGSTDDQRMWGAGVDYTNGPLAVGAVYHRFNDLGNTLTGVKERDLTEWFVGGSYDFGMAKLTGSYQDFDADNTGATISTASVGAGKNNLNGDIWSVGVIVPVMKAGSVRLSYASLDRSVKTAGVKVNQDADGWGISYQHAMSKRTTAYVGYTTIDNDGGATGGTLGVGLVGGPTAGGDSKGYGAGLRHTF